MKNYNFKDFYHEKVQFLLNYGYKEYRPIDFYREMFPQGSFQQANETGGFKPNGLIQLRYKGDTKKTLITMIVNDSLHEIGIVTDRQPDFENVEFSTVSGCSYIGKHKTNKNARMCHALIIDIDAVDVTKLRNIIGLAESKLIPMPTAITVSGNGVHIVYMLSEPVPLYPAKVKMLSDLKAMLTRKLWNERTSFDPNIQYQGIVQGYRTVGTPTKKGHLTRAFKLSGKVNIEDLISSIDEIDIAPFLKPENGEIYSKRIIQCLKNKKLAEQMLEELCYYSSHIPIDEAKELWPDWYERIIVKKERPGHWETNRAVYDWWLDKISNLINVKVGHRRNCIYCLAAFAQKCNINEKEFIEDAYSFLEPYESLTNSADNHFTKNDIQSAVDMYYSNDLTRMSKKAIERLSGIEMPKKERKSQKLPLKEQLKLCRAKRDAHLKEGEVWYNTDGRPTVENKIKEYLSAYPDERNISKISRETGVSRPSVYKYLNINS